MKIAGCILMCALLLSCARQPASPEPGPAQPPVRQELALLHEMHAQFLAFRDDDIFMRHGFTFNSPYADWLQRVRDLERTPDMAEPARLLANLAVAARMHGVQSEVYRQFENRFDQALRAPVGQESVRQQPSAQEPAGLEDAGQESADQKSSGQAPAALTARGPAVSSPAGSASAVSILFSGDTQGVVYPQPGQFGSVGGLERRTSAIAHFRKEDPGLVVLDAGDTFASGFARAERINKVLVRAMNHHRYDAMGLGGFDLDMGEVALRELAAMARFPMICSNLEFQGGVAPWIKPYAIFERNGLRIAVLSILQTPIGANITGGRFVAPEKALDTLLPKLRSTADVVVLLTQLAREEAARLLGEGNMVDAILGDHASAAGANPAYVPAVPKGMGFGLLRLNMVAPGAPVRVEAMPVLLGGHSDAQLLQILGELK